MSAEGDPAAAGQQVGSANVDALVESRTYVTPVGGEIVVDSAESFDYPAEVASDDEMKSLHTALSQVLDDQRNDGGRSARFQETLIDRIESAGPDDDLDVILQSIPVD